MSRSLALCWVALTSLTFAACDARTVDPCTGQAGACVALYVDGSPAPINKLTIQVPELGADKGTTAESAGQKLFAPPIVVGVLINASFLSETPRELTFAVTGFAGAEVKGLASKTVSIAANEHVVVHVTLSNANADGSVSADLAGLDFAGTDLTGVDASVIDQSMPALDLEGALLDLEPPDLVIEPDLGPACGNGKVEFGEECDDGNQLLEDGCESCARSSGWVCPTEGMPCRAAACGDGKIAGIEQCDDSNSNSSDGCAGCRQQPGYDCSATPPGNPCPVTVCGDGAAAGLESCDDANNYPFDGCWQCNRFPSCATGACDAICGDGIKLPSEPCDDGNNIKNDGCSPTCTIEPLWQCANAPIPAAIVLPILYRDFKKTGVADGHPDFEAFSGPAGGPVATTGLIGATLGSDNLPTFLSSQGSGSTTMITSSGSFSSWYHDSTLNKPIADSITLAKQGSSLAYQFDATVFNPLNGKGWMDTAGSCSGTPNLSFTSQIQYFFVYEDTAPAFKIEVRGDDDNWVFINRKLVIDLGGLHDPMVSSYEITPAHAADLGLVSGQVYRVDIFQAERKSCGSTFRLTITNPRLPRSACTVKP